MLYTHDCSKGYYSFRCIQCLQPLQEKTMNLHLRQCRMPYFESRRRRQTLYRCMRCFDLHSHLQLLTPPRHTCGTHLWDVVPRISPAIRLLWWEHTMNAEPRIPYHLLQQHRRWYNRTHHTWQSYHDLYGEYLYNIEDSIFYH